MERVQHPHQRRRQRDERQRRQHDARELHGERELARRSRVNLSSANSRDERLGEDDAENHERAGDDDERVDDVVAQPPRRRPCRRRVRCRVNVGTKAALIAPSANRSRSRLGNAEGDVVGVHRGAVAPKYAREHLLADQAEHAARHGGGAGRRGRAREPSKTSPGSGAKLAADGLVDRLSVGVLAGEHRHHRLHHLAHVL